ncbi:class II aldolase/adducin family protein [Streptomyces sp. CA-132043]|uniref:class II aldolase/adducin family protein n=1 Tax=Streptomyces sp. CA-132043 TaxID=3240048 RepID=UPI003D92C5A2
MSTYDARDTCRQQLVDAIHLLGALGYGHGLAGYMSARDPQRDDCYWVNPLGVDFRRLRVDDLLLIGPDGEVVDGQGELNPSVDPLHGELHRARPDLAAFTHTHSPLGKAWSALGRPLAPITQDSCALFERHALYAEFGGPVTDRTEGKQIATVLGDRMAVILRNHGFLTGGRTIAEAAWLHVVMERAAEVQLLAEGAGEPYVIPDDIARATARMLSKVEYANAQFRNLYATTCTRL